MRRDTGAPVTIDYHRPPGRSERFHQRLVAREDGCVVTLLEAAPLPHAVEVAGRTVLEPGASVVWFTFADTWHDIGRFHRADGRFTGLYANVLTPVTGVEGTAWETTDLFLDVWLGAGSREPTLLDEDELAAAEAAGWVDRVTAERARTEAAGLLDAAAAGEWPPPVVARWPLAAARAALGVHAPGHGGS